MILKNKKGQSSVEYAILLIIVIGSFLAIQNYVKRGIQGRWKESVDNLGDQYDPRTAVTNVTHTLQSVTNTEILVVGTPGGQYTQRTDQSSSTEAKTGTMTVGSY